MSVACGWDIGGVNLKVAWTTVAPGGRPRLTWIEEPFAIFREPRVLARRLRRLARRIAAGAGAPRRRLLHAVTMTAELSDVFPTRAAGVRAILRAVHAALGEEVRVLDARGGLVGASSAARRPAQVAAAHWTASAVLAARAVGGSGLLVDVGSTTTDIVPLDAGRPVPRGRSDLQRLLAGELLYTGALRTPPAALLDRVPLRGAACPVAPEHFTIMADVYRLLGRLPRAAYTMPTPDGRGAGRSACAARLARLVCAEPDEIGAAALRRIASSLARRQEERIAGAMRAVLRRAGLPAGRRRRRPVAVLAGSGWFVGAAAARRAGFRPVRLEALLPGLGRGWDRVAPAAALALLLREEAGAARSVRHGGRAAT